MPNFVRFGTTNAVLPKEGPMCFPFVMDFNTGGQASQTLDLTVQQQQDLFSNLQGFYCDNSQNANLVTFQVQGTGQKLICPANKQMYMCALFNDQPVLQVTTTLAAGLKLPVYLLNFPVDPIIW